VRIEITKEFPFKLIALAMKQDDPKKCSAAKLNRFGFIKNIYRATKIPSKAIVLNPLTDHVLIPGDSVYVQYGLVVIDCSWERFRAEFVSPTRGVGRRLPSLLAANPINYGHIGKLSSVEAWAAALYMMGAKSEAEMILSKFKWGSTFLTLNADPLKEYSIAKDEREILEIEKSYF
jgi:pre-rRNA-processing protein TSR3